MKKKIIAAFLSLALAGMLFTGCGNAENNPARSTDSGEATNEQKEIPNAQVGEEVYTLTMTYPTGGTDPIDLDKIEEKLSEMTMEKIQCKVEFVPVSMADMATKYNMWFANGTKMDIMCTVFMDYLSLINAGGFMPMDDLLEGHADELLAKDAEKNFLQAGVYQGKQYGIPTIPAAPGNGGAMYMRKDVFEQLDLSEINLNDYLNYEELDNIFAQIDEKFPGYTEFGISGGVGDSLYFLLKNYDALGVSGGSAGVLLDPVNETKVENLFASDEYYEYLTWMRKWYQDGYIPKDAATATENGTALFNAGKAATIIAMNTAGTRYNVQDEAGFEVVQLDLCPNYMTTNVYTGVMFFIPNNSERPEKAMEFLNLLFTDVDIQNLLACGIEGDHFTVQDNGRVIDYTENRENYICPLGVWGDQSEWYIASPRTLDLVKEQDDYLQVSLDHTSKAFGYLFDASEVSTEQATIKGVISKYLSQLEYGSVDLDIVYPEFISALEKAGINEVIAENQKQLDVWLAAQ